MGKSINLAADWSAPMAQLKEMQADIKADAAALQAKRDAANSLKKQMFANLQAAIEPGTNHLHVEGFGSVKFSYSEELKVDEDTLATVREEYGKLNDRPVDLDALLRVKHEIAKAQYKKLSGEALKTFNQCVTSKPSNPEVTFAD